MKVSKKTRENLKTIFILGLLIAFVVADILLITKGTNSLVTGKAITVNILAFLEIFVAIYSYGFGFVTSIVFGLQSYTGKEIYRNIIKYMIIIILIAYIITLIGVVLSWFNVITSISVVACMYMIFGIISLLKFIIGIILIIKS
ncbi:MAG: hypothetical protein E7311_05000 [Clostridiales bacterium]|nr:hypothetical protein [Clostridiales bacterium]